MKEDHFLTSLRDSYRQTADLPSLPPELAGRLSPLRRLLGRYPPPGEPGDYLLVIAEPDPPRWVELPLNGLVVGRDDACDLQIERPWLSSEQCDIRWDAGHWTVRDLESRNGTWLNGQQIQSQHLRAGDAIQAGSLTLLYLRVHRPPSAVPHHRPADDQ